MAEDQRALIAQWRKEAELFDGNSNYVSGDDFGRLEALRKCADELEALLVRPPAEESAAGDLTVETKWHPINTAPKDGTLVLVCDADGKMAIAKRYDQTPEYWTGEDGLDFDYGDWQPTHWMPLPDPPSEPKE